MPYIGQAHEFSGEVEPAEHSGEANVNTPSPAWLEMEKDRSWPRLLLHAGQRGVRAAGTKYLPAFQGEEDSENEYRARLKRSFLVNFYQRGVNELVSRMFAKPLMISEDAPDKVREWWADVDDEGTLGDNFFQTAAEDAVGQGLTAVLPDMPRTAESFANEAEEERAGIRPRLVHHRAEAVIEALKGTALGMPVLKRLRLRRRDSTVEGYEYGSKQTVREYRMGNPNAWRNATREDDLGARFCSFRTHTEPENQQDEWDADGWQVLRPSRKATPDQQRLFLEPLLVPMYAGKIGFWMARPPMLEGAELNMQHWQKKSDIDNQEHVALVPTLDIEGADEESVGTVQIGANRVLYHPEGSKAQWLTLDPRALERAHKTLEHLEGHILKAMLDPMQQRATSKQLATVRLLDESRPVTLAQAMLVNFQYAINRSMAIMCAWVGIEYPEEPAITFQQDVFKDLADPRAGNLLLEMAMADPPLLTPGRLYAELQNLGRLDSDVDVDAEVLELMAYREGVGTEGL